MKNSIIFTLLSLLMVGCNNEIIYFYSLDKSQCITVINHDHVRYIINGRHSELPESNFVKLNVQDIDPLDDGLYVCWNTTRYRWEVVVHNSIVIESRLDTAKYNIETSLPTDDRGIPNELKFRQDGCAVFDFLDMRLSPNKGAIVEY